MSSIHTPQQKKQLAYKRDHYNRNGENNKAWRKAKPLRKAKARRAFRKANKDLLRVCADDPESVPQGPLRKQNSIQQRRVTDWGAIHLKEFVATRRVSNSLNAGAKKARRKAREARLKNTG
jgi:hypothetical protein